MIEANEINSNFYALRLLSDGVDTSQIQVTEGEEYPASEFTKEEQEQALKIIHLIEDSEPASLNQLPAERIHFHLEALADRIEELANNELVNAGYVVETTLPRPYQRDTDSSSTRHQEAVRRSGGEDFAGQNEDDEVVIVWAAVDDYELLAANIEQVSHRLNFRPEVVNQIKLAIVDTCNRMSKYTISSGRKIHVGFRVKNDKLVMTIASRDKPPLNAREIEESARLRRDDLGDPAEQRRGWGLKHIKTLMDEVEIELVDEGTHLRITKYGREANPSARRP